MSDPVRDAPRYFVQVAKPGFQKQRVDVSDRVLSLEFEDTDNAADTLKLTVNNFDLRFFDDPLWQKWNTVTVQWGYAGNMAPARDCVIDTVKGFLVLTITGHGAAVRMNQVVKNRVFENMRRSDVVAQLALEAGWTGNAVDIDPTSVVYETVQQAGLTDAQFIKRLAYLEGFQFYVDANGFHFHKRRLARPPLREVTYYAPPARGEVLDIAIDSEIFSHPGGITVAGRDPLEKKDINEKGSNSDTQRDGLAPVIGVFDSDTGDYTEKVNAVETTHPTPAADAATAKAHADGRFRLGLMGVIEMTLRHVGDPLLEAKQIIQLAGVGKTLAGRYYIRTATHVVGASGYETKLKLLRDGMSEFGRANAAAQDSSPTADPDQLVPVDVPDADTGRFTTEYRPPGSKGGTKKGG